MRNFIKQQLRERLTPKNKPETFSAYHGRYLFDVKKAYDLIDSGKIKPIIKKFNPVLLKQFSHPEFSAVDRSKMEKIKSEMDYTKPIGLLVKFVNPEDQKTEWILIDGNHRTRIAGDEGQEALLYVIDNPQIVNTFMKTDITKKHQMFQDDDEIE